mgnify:CR=1 FL=1
MKKKITLGILAHVDAGKTTLSEALLYISGKLRTPGRVDHKNTFLDTYPIERERGITVFSKQARFSTPNSDIILLDTPGHEDFSTEAERTLSLLDYAILVVSGTDGVQNHTRTLWTLLEHYGVPVFIFINKTDITTKSEEELESQISGLLSLLCVSFKENQPKHDLDEKLALLNEDFFESFLSSEPIKDSEIAKLIGTRKLFPCLYGSALKMTGIDFLIDTIDKYTLNPAYDGEKFGAKVYKISNAGALRLTYMKITGGSLSVRDELHYRSADRKEHTEKVSLIRLYSGEKYKQVDSVSAGEICAVGGLSSTYIGQGLGEESNSQKPVIEPVLSYRIKLPPECDPIVYFPKLKELEEEEPSLHLYWNEELRQVEAGLMGDMQTDLLKRMISERFAISCEIDTGKILYKEKIAKKALGIGHYEPLRHYAEVQLLLEPQPKGTGLVFDTRFSEYIPDTNWQRQILSVLYEKKHRGILTGAELTDTKITLVAERSHPKHTEGGDFREATLRAVRQGLMKAGCVLLEPYYKFRIQVPNSSLGRTMSDLRMKAAEFETESTDSEITVLCGRAPVANLQGYTRELVSYTSGRGKMSCTIDGYETCHNQNEIVNSIGYNPEADITDTPHSVFCAHGAGFTVTWKDVDKYKHIDCQVPFDSLAEAIIPNLNRLKNRYHLDDKELETIMLREFGPIKRRKYSEPKVISAEKDKKSDKNRRNTQNRMLIVDGYNVIHSWESLSDIAKFSLEKARETLMDILSSYVAYTKTELVLVFDAYLVKDGQGSDFLKDGYRVVFTKQDQTADTFIEKMMHELGPDYNIRVVTSDRLLQFSAVHSGILRMTAKEFEAEVTSVGNEITEFVNKLAENNS